MCNISICFPNIVPFILRLDGTELNDDAEDAVLHITSICSFHDLNASGSQPPLPGIHDGWGDAGLLIAHLKDTNYIWSADVAGRTYSVSSCQAKSVWDEDVTRKKCAGVFCPYTALFAFA